ncbi:hypothetical protein TRSC58_05715 [Trypanosoma rangeli SC58]|uniref:Uncharacterized protein n=1 Tax=Trypanosoma rangeli SC58 TaxID=429131 RepID=A0A061IU63_TRYRA|nr:hypothetical protein TRSC58_05715 [Trypanosoma rangeli SC58]
MSEKSRRVVPGTQLCYRALYATIVGGQPLDCLPGTSVKMSSEGPILVDHVMRAARRYASGNAPPTAPAEEVPSVPEDGPSKTMHAELLRAMEELRHQNQQYQRDLETRTQQLEMRKQEVQALQNKLRVVHMEAKRRGYNFHDVADRGQSRSTDHKKTHEAERLQSKRDSTPPRGMRGGGGAGRSGEYSRPPLPPLRVDGTLVSTLATPSSQPPSPYQLQSSCPPPPYGQEPQLVANNGVAAAALALLSPASQSGNVAGDDVGGGSDLDVVAKPVLPQLLLEEDVRGNCEEGEAKCEDVTSVSFRPPPSRKNGSSPPVLPQHLVSQNPGAMLFCCRCRLFLPPHPVSVTNHLQSEGHQNSADASPPPGTTYTQFGKLVQRMPSFIEPATVVSAEQRQKETTAGNVFFESGFDIVNSICGICQEIVTTQSYKVHESLPTHRRRLAETNADAMP